MELDAFWFALEFLGGEGERWGRGVPAGPMEILDHTNQSVSGVRSWHLAGLVNFSNH